MPMPSLILPAVTSSLPSAHSSPCRSGATLAITSLGQFLKSAALARKGAILSAGTLTRTMPSRSGGGATEASGSFAGSMPGSSGSPAGGPGGDPDCSDAIRLSPQIYRDNTSREDAENRDTMNFPLGHSTVGPAGEGWYGEACPGGRLPSLSRSSAPAVEV